LQIFGDRRRLFRYFIALGACGVGHDSLLSFLESSVYAVLARRLNLMQRIVSAMHSTYQTDIQ
jgi:hypothetical protein